MINNKKQSTHNVNTDGNRGYSKIIFSHINRIFLATQWTVFYVQCFLTLLNGIVPPKPCNGISLPPYYAICKPLNNPGLEKKSTISQSQILRNHIIRNENLCRISHLDESKMNQLYDAAFEFSTGRVNADELLEKVLKLRGGASIIEILASVAIAIGMTILLNNFGFFGFGSSFDALKPGQSDLFTMWIHDGSTSNKPFGYGSTNNGPRSLSQLTQNAGSENDFSSHGTWDYAKIMRNLDSQRGKKLIEIEVGHTIYKIKNEFSDDATDELSEKLASQIYTQIRENEFDVSSISKNLGCKAENIYKVKSHVFLNKHKLDLYEHLDEPVEFGRFDPYLSQTITWKRLKLGIHSQDNITWLKRECAERRHERAQTYFDGKPWNMEF